jgi:predicted ArsR family transcriptional regulator
VLKWTKGKTIFWQEGPGIMQATRQRIVELLREQGESTVEELAEAVGLTHMAIRHHLNVLQSENLVISSRVRRQKAPGRPQQLYSLTETADGLFPEDYYSLSKYLLDELNLTMGYQGTVKFLQQIAGRLAAEAPAAIAGQSFAERLGQVTGFLTKNGFVSLWEQADDGYTIHTLTCPFRQIAHTHRELCEMDMALVRHLLDVEPLRTSCIVEDGDRCTYVFDHQTFGQELAL